MQCIRFVDSTLKRIVQGVNKECLNNAQERYKPFSTIKSDYPKNCHDVRAAGAAPLHIGQPGYGQHLDRDGDGVACE